MYTKQLPLHDLEMHYLLYWHLAYSYTIVILGLITEKLSMLSVLFFICQTPVH